MSWPFLIGVVHQNQLYVLNWKTLLPNETIEKLEDPSTRWVCNRPVRHTVLNIYEYILGEVTWIKDSGCDSKCPDQWEACTAFVDYPHLEDVFDATNTVYLKYQCDPSESLLSIWDKVVWTTIDGVLNQQLYSHLDVQYQSHVLTREITENIVLHEKIDNKRKM